jgi:hypothetical protein
MRRHHHQHHCFTMALSGRRELMRGATLLRLTRVWAWRPGCRQFSLPHLCLTISSY